MSSLPTLNSFKVTCASRHTQRPHPCKKKVSLAETPIPTGIKEDPRSPGEDTQGANAAKQNSPMEIALGDDTDHARLAEADLCNPSKGQCRNCTGSGRDPDGFGVVIILISADLLLRVRNSEASMCD